MAVILLALLAMTAIADDSVDVQALTDATYDTTLQENDHVMVKFYAPWCGHCKRLAPDYEKAADMLKEKGSKAILAEVDCTVEKDTCSKNEVRGYPTLKFFEKGNFVEKYSGKRTAEDIVDYVLEKSGGK